MKKLLRERPMSRKELKDRILVEFEVDDQTCDEAVRRFTGELIENGLVNVAQG